MCATCAIWSISSLTVAVNDLHCLPISRCLKSVWTSVKEPCLLVQSGVSVHINTPTGWLPILPFWSSCTTIRNDLWQKQWQPGWLTMFAGTWLIKNDLLHQMAAGGFYQRYCICSLSASIAQALSQTSHGQSAQWIWSKDLNKTQNL